MHEVSGRPTLGLGPLMRREPLDPPHPGLEMIVSIGTSDGDDIMTLLNLIGGKLIGGFRVSGDPQSVFLCLEDGGVHRLPDNLLHGKLEPFRKWVAMRIAQQPRAK